MEEGPRYRLGTVEAESALRDLPPEKIKETVDLKSGDARASVWTNDLTHAYVHENSAYST